MNKEIGGYMELEHFTGQEYYPALHKTNLGRTALIWLLQAVPCRKIHLPVYLCDSVFEAAQKTGVAICPYNLDEDLNPVFPDGAEPADEDILYLVNYYGQLTEDRIRYHQSSYRNIIVDNAQAFYDKPLDGVHTIYSCRKFFGVSDGAYVATEASLPQNIPEDHSHMRMSHLLGRWEEGAGAYYRTMLEIADGFAHEVPRKMSVLTENLLRGIDYTQVQEKRRNNYRILKRLLPSDNPFNKVMPAAPFAYPFFHPRGIELRKKLAERKIFVPTNWSFLLRTVPETSLEYQWSANILPLPVDQRYGEKEMEHIAKVIDELSK